MRRPLALLLPFLLLGCGHPPSRTEACPVDRTSPDCAKMHAAVIKASTPRCEPPNFDYCLFDDPAGCVIDVYIQEALIREYERCSGKPYPRPWQNPKITHPNQR